MITVKVKVENGQILALEPVDEALEGKEFTITVNDTANGESMDTDDAEGERIRSSWDSLMKFIRENSIDTGITDMAHQHDHYLYGTPKRKD